jgi:hypothetical protein
MAIEILSCDCLDCFHWEVVRLENGTIHLRCKTCERTDELDSFTVHEQPGNQVKWVKVDAE